MQCTYPFIHHNELSCWTNMLRYWQIFSRKIILTVFRIFFLNSSSPKDMTLKWFESWLKQRKKMLILFSVAPSTQKTCHREVIKILCSTLDFAHLHRSSNATSVSKVNVSILIGFYSLVSIVFFSLFTKFNISFKVLLYSNYWLELIQSSH